ncbi:MAG: hypothetical protein AAF447_07230 [Myxococcota bacterium]
MRKRWSATWGGVSLGERLGSTLPAAPLLLAIALLVAPGGAYGVAQTRTRARDFQPEDFHVVVAAADELFRVEVQPADANGELRAWDARWSARLEEITRSRRPNCALATECTLRAACALLPADASLGLSLARRQLLSPYGSREDARIALDEEVRNLARRRLVAEEAMQRRRERLSCEDLPWGVEVDLDDATASRGGWITEGWVVAALRDAESALVYARDGVAGLRARQPTGEAAATTRVDSDTDEAPR